MKSIRGHLLLASLVLFSGVQGHADGTGTGNCGCMCNGQAVYYPCGSPPACCSGSSSSSGGGGGGGYRGPDPAAVWYAEHGVSPHSHAFGQPQRRPTSGTNDSVLASLRQGNAALMRYDWAAAESAFRLALGWEPDNPTALQGLGYALYQMGRAAESEQTLRRALERNPSGAAKTILSTLRMLAGRRLYETGDIASAEAAYLEALSLDPASTEARQGLDLIRGYRRALDRVSAAPTRQTALEQLVEADAAGKTSANAGLESAKAASNELFDTPRPTIPPVILPEGPRTPLEPALRDASKEREALEAQIRVLEVEPPSPEREVRLADARDAVDRARAKEQFLDAIRARVAGEPPGWQTLAGSPTLKPADRDELERSRTVLLAESRTIEVMTRAHEAACAAGSVTGSAALTRCAREQEAIQSRRASYGTYLSSYQNRLAEETKQWERWKKPVLVGGTTWTFGANLMCDEPCRKAVTEQLRKQMDLFCASNESATACTNQPRRLPFNPDEYGLIVSVGSSHGALQDLATRVLFDHTSYGKYSREHREAFALVTGTFERIDCHSNGALMCLAAVRAGDLQAKEIRLFGPQMSPEAARRWAEVAREKGIAVRIYVANGDPVLGASWTLPRSTAGMAAAATATSAAAIELAPAAAVVKIQGTEPEVAEGATRLLGGILLPKQTQDAKDAIATLGLPVVTLPCADASEVDLERALDCHSASRYQEIADKYERGRLMEIRTRK